MLLKGSLLFLTIGLLFFLIILGVEYFLWLNSTGRFVLFLLFVMIELFLAVAFIIVPLIYLFKLKRGLDHKEASLLIGKHFKEVDDKLYNLLDLAESASKSELLMASIEQRSAILNPIPFTKAIDYKDNTRYIKFLSIPILLIAVIWIFGDFVSFLGSYKRMVNYDLAYEPPAPFIFKVLTPNLNVPDSEPFTLKVTTEGKIRPQEISLVLGNKEFLLQENKGTYSYLFTPPHIETGFHFSANGIDSRPYRLNVVSTPRLQDFELLLTYPSYTKKSEETIKSTGNATVPEGTRVQWKIGAINTTKVTLNSPDTSLVFDKTKGYFSKHLNVYAHLDYTISTSNQEIREYEKLEYSISVLKDAHPTLKVEQLPDSLHPNIFYYKGEATDDYGLSRIQLIYYPTDNESEARTLELSRPEQNYSSFYYTFPSGLELQEGKEYSYYFEVLDNDGIHRPKAAKSRLFTTIQLGHNELINKNIDSRKPILDKLDKSLEMFKKQQKDLRELNKQQKEKSSLNFNDQTKIKDFLRNQEQQQELMQKFQKELKDNLRNGNEDDKQNKLLRERLERQEIEARKNEKLLEELNRLAEKINKEELAKQLEELGKKQQSNERNLEQLLELTKRYYIQEKVGQLAFQLENLAKEEEELSKSPIENESTKKEQVSINEQFQEISKELEQLQKDNQGLKKPMDLPVDKEKENRIREDQKEAVEAMEEYRQSTTEPTKPEEREQVSERAKSKQRSAARLMKEMAQSLNRSVSVGQASSMAEDATVLRQLLDNLVTLSLKQENLFYSLNDLNIDIAINSEVIKKQQELRELFTHIDDGLLELSLRWAALSEFVNEQITEVYYNMDKTLESLPETQYYQGGSYQKYTLTAVNSLADFLADILDNMQQQMQMGSAQGKGNGFQLPDIIMGQKQLQERMQRNERDPKSNDNPKDGKQEKNEKEGRDKNQRNRTGQEQNTDRASEPNEKELKEIYDIYKEQQKLREQLEGQLKNMIREEERAAGKKLIGQMEEFQNELLENGITKESMERMNHINHELMKLENAVMEQGEKEERKSNTATQHFQNPILTIPEVFQNNRNEVEILNRQALPLQQNFKDRVKEYFRIDD